MEWIHAKKKKKKKKKKKIVVWDKLRLTHNTRPSLSPLQRVVSDLETSGAAVLASSSRERRGTYGYSAPALADKLRRSEDLDHPTRVPIRVVTCLTPRYRHLLPYFIHLLSTTP